MSSAFRLATVLRLREAAEERARAELARALNVRRLASEAVDRARAALEAEAVLAEATTRTRRPACAIADAVDDVARSRRAVEAAADRCAAAETAVAAARERLATVTRQLEVVERLRERVVRAERHEADRREQSVLDELGLLGHAAGGSGHTTLR